MGLLEKAAAYRWMKQGPGGGSGGGEGLGPLGLILVAIMLFWMVMMALSAIFSFIYNALRAVLMIAPTLSTLLLGVLFALLLLALVPSHSPEQASEYLSSNDTFVAKSVLSLVLLAFLFSGSAYETVPDIGASIGILEPLIIVSAALYSLYALYRSTGLIGSLPEEVPYQFAILFPLTAGIIQSVFSLPLYSILGDLLGLAFIAVFPASLLTVQYRVKPLLDGA